MSKLLIKLVASAAPQRVEWDPSVSTNLGLE
jgi:hypothetical protein